MLKAEGKKRGKAAFAIDRFSRVDMSDQLADRLKAAIAAGRYGPGDVLPTMQQLAEIAGVSFRTARGAIERLTREGYVNPRPRIGSVVMPKDITVWRGHVLFVFPEEDEPSYFVNVLANELRRRFVGAGYLFSRVTASRRTGGDRSQLSTMLGQTIDFAIVMYGSPPVARDLAAAGVPYLIVGGDGRSRKGAWSTIPGEDGPISRFVDHCRAAGVRTVVEVGFGSPGASTSAKRLEEAGISVSRLEVRPQERYGRLEGIERASLSRFLAFDRRSFPDLFLFWDDFVAQGALTAFLSRGVAIPEEVKVVALSNRGFGPVYIKSITRFECDAAYYGERVSEFVLAVLSRRRAQPPTLKPTYVIGATFPY